ncbi:MAG: RecX family transcriptional regulator [Patescibacteria group bacterium]|nr:RecX family transcriptional regulator [Patescibacteria group bacterium]
MGKITKIKLQETSKRANIFIDGKFKFGLDIENILLSNLKLGQEIDEARLKELVFKGEVSRLLERIGKFLAIRPRSEKEIRDRLSQKLYKRELSEFIDRVKLKNSVLEKLSKLDFIDDEKFAKWWVQQRNQFRPKGKRALMVELRTKGVDDEAIKKALAFLGSEKDLIKRLTDKKLKTLQRFSKKQKKEKTIQFLLRKGFSWEEIKETVGLID